MTVTPETVAEILALPVKERAFLARTIIESLDEGSESDWEEEWKVELDQRNEQIGAAGSAPVEQVLKEIRADLASRRSS